MSATSRVGRVILSLRLKVRLMFWTLDKERLSSGIRDRLQCDVTDANTER